MKKKVLSVIVLATMLSCGGKQTPIELKATGKAVTVAEAKLSGERSEMRYSGTIEASRTIPLTFQTSGTVLSVLVQAGDKVSKGQLLATVDKASSQNMYDIANAKYQQAKDAYDRLKKVYDSGSLPEIKWVEMQTNLEQAQSSLAMSRESLDKCNLKAPSDGIVGERNIEPGMSAISITGAPIKLVEINDVYIVISVPENELNQLKKGQKATITVSALGEKTVSGEIATISPVADAISRTYEAKILVHNPQQELKPGMVCDVTIAHGKGAESVLVPYQSVGKDANGDTYIFVVDTVSRRVHKQKVKTGMFSGSDLEVTDGLTVGQTVVREGKDRLSDNDQITF